MVLFEFINKGIYCLFVDVYIDFWCLVSKVLIIYGYVDYFCWGYQYYFCIEVVVLVIWYWFGNINFFIVQFGEVMIINGVKFFFYLAGYIVGFVQICVEYKGEVWVVLGDYKVVFDGLFEFFELVCCYIFIIEFIFGLLVYCWKL